MVSQATRASKTALAEQQATQPPGVVTKPAEIFIPADQIIGKPAEVQTKPAEFIIPADQIPGYSPELSSGSIEIQSGSYVTSDGQILPPGQASASTLPEGAQHLTYGGRLESDGRIVDNATGMTVYDSVHGLLPPGAQWANGMHLLPNGQTEMPQPGDATQPPGGTQVLGVHDYDVGGYILMENGNQVIKPGSWIDGTGNILSNEQFNTLPPSDSLKDGYVQLDEGGILRGDVLHTSLGSFVISGVNSTEYANLEAMVETTYRDVLGREGDRAGIANWLRVAEGLRAEGMSDAAIQTHLTDRFKESNEFIVKDAYRQVLGRDGDASGVDHWIKVAEGLEAQGYSPDQIEANLFEQFRTSDEGIVKTRYRELLGREGDAGGVEHWMSVAKDMRAEGKTSAEIENFLNEQFMGSEEYQNRIADGGPPVFSTGQLMSSPGFQHFVAEPLASGVSHRSEPQNDGDIPPLPDAGSSVSEGEELKLQLIKEHIGRFVDLNGSTTVTNHGNGTVSVSFEGSVGGGVGVNSASLPFGPHSPANNIDSNVLEGSASGLTQTEGTFIRPTFSMISSAVLFHRKGFG